MRMVRAVALMSVFIAALYLPAGRLDWVAGWAFLAAFLAFALGVSLWTLRRDPALLAKRENTYLSKMVRIQNDRGHRVITTGPYRYVRHPMYVGVILFIACVPLVLGSWWAEIPAGLIAALFVLRTALEDRMLHDELPGYREYAQQVHYRLAPGVW